MKVDTLGGEQRWVASDRVDVALSNSDRNRADRHVGPFGEFPIKLATGPEWANIFVGVPGKSPLFTVANATLTDELFAAGFAARFTYSISGTLTFNGRDYPISAQGSRAAALKNQAARHEAIQLGIVDAARKVKAVISGSAAPLTGP